eukprot:TRINITY_DN43_c0_g2_i1.p1 TRINITY_DN43_c0_g2~~TRINITY_DN43_c0_g2_i1.p1  ORF type:complete len:329 (+),score=72.69 TRINITY_DN43_c0_g2_i1:74-1060(+)
MGACSSSPANQPKTQGQRKAQAPPKAADPKPITKKDSVRQEPPKEEPKVEAKPKINEKDWAGEISIRTLQKETITVKASADLLVFQLKELISKEAGLAPRDHMLLLEDKPDELLDTMTLKDCGVYQNSFLVIRERPQEASIHSSTSVSEEDVPVVPWEGNLIVKTLVHSNNWQITDVNNDTLVSEVKEMLCQKQQRYEPNTFTLVFAGKTMKDKHPLSRYRISEGSTLVLVHTSAAKSPKADKGQPWSGLFGVKTLTGDTLNLVTSSSETVLGLKKKIAERKDGNELWVESLQRLVYEGDELQDDRELSTYGIQQTSLVVVLLKRRRK